MKKRDEVLNTVICGDATSVLRDLPDGCCDAIVTSPPYFSQRDYGNGVQIGNEKTPDQYVARLTGVFRECYRVLSDRGTLWLNLGDKYHKKQLLGMPWRIALALQAEGWYLRSDIIWHKPNAMPSPVKMRPTVDHEYIFLFSKKNDYYYDADAIREPHVTFTSQSKMRGGRGHFGKAGGTPEQGKYGNSANLHKGRWDQAFHPLGRNKRTVWSIPLSKNREPHFAVFPEKLITPCVLAGCPPGGVVLDPFIGSGTTALVALRLGRKFIGIDCQPQYCKMAREKVSGVQSQLLS